MMEIILCYLAFCAVIGLVAGILGGPR